MSNVTIDSRELEALRVLAQKALGLDLKRSRRGVDVSALPFTWQETNAAETLAMARGDVVPQDRIIKHIHNKSKAVADTWVVEPTTVISRIRMKLRASLGAECIQTVWYTRVNHRGQVVRDLERGIEGYRWIGPDIAGDALTEIISRTGGVK